MSETQNAKPKMFTDFRPVFGPPYWLVDVNGNWSTTNAMEQIEAFCEVLESLEISDKSSSKDDRYARLNVRAVNSSYAFEIAMKSFWALDNPRDKVIHTHKLPEILRGLKKDTLESLEQIGVTPKSIFMGLREPFVFNRYLMEGPGIKPGATYTSQFLRDVKRVLKETLTKRVDEVMDGLAWDQLD